MTETTAKQTDDHVQNSALGSVNPRAEHPGSGNLVPVSAHTTEDDPKVTGIEDSRGPSGHDIGQKEIEKSSTTGAEPIAQQDKQAAVDLAKKDALQNSDQQEKPASVYPRVTTGAPQKDGTSV